MLPAASFAATLYRYVVDGCRPVSEKVVPATEAAATPSRNTV